MTANELALIRESGAGKMFYTGDDVIQVLQLQGSWFEMGRQYGAFAKEGMQQVWDASMAFLPRIAGTVRGWLRGEWVGEAIRSSWQRSRQCLSGAPR
jgi:hypothetical protein